MPSSYGTLRSVGIRQRLRPKRLPISKKPRVFPFQPLETKARRSFTTQKKFQVLSY